MATILLVDDESHCLKATATLLEEIGRHEVIPALGLLEGIIKARDLSFDLLVTDKNLGFKRGVVPLLDYMERERAHIPIIIHSAEDGEQARKELYCQGYHNKLDGSMKLLETIRGLVG